MSDHPIFAAVYDRLLAGLEAAGLTERRRRLLSEVRGRTLEIGGGTGLNLAHYSGIERLVMVEPDGAMRRRLLERLPSSPVPVEVHEVGIEDAPFPDGSFDTVVSTLVLCSVPDLDRALSSVRRLLVPDGRFLFLEHVAATGWRGHAQQALAPLWRRLVGGCELHRDITAAIRRAGFMITDCERFDMPAGGPVVKPSVQGIARPAKAAAWSERERATDEHSGVSATESTEEAP